MQLFNSFKKIFSKTGLFPRPKILQFVSQYLLTMISKLNVLFKLGHTFPKSLLLGIDPDEFCACGPQEKHDVT